MRLLTPMTFIVVLVLAACLIAGLLILFLSARKVKSSPVDPTCPRCGAANRARAKFCAHCGAEILSRNPNEGASGGLPASARADKLPVAHDSGIGSKIESQSKRAL